METSGQVQAQVTLPPGKRGTFTDGRGSRMALSAILDDMERSPLTLQGAEPRIVQPVI